MRTMKIRWAHCIVLRAETYEVSHMHQKIYYLFDYVKLLLASTIKQKNDILFKLS